MTNPPTIIAHPEAMTRCMMRAILYGRRMQLLDSSYNKCINILRTGRKMNEWCIERGYNILWSKEDRRTIGEVLLKIRGDKSRVRLCMAVNKAIACGEMPEDFLED